MHAILAILAMLRSYQQTLARGRFFFVTSSNRSRSIFLRSRSSSIHSSITHSAHFSPPPFFLAFTFQD